MKSIKVWMSLARMTKADALRGAGKFVRIAPNELNISDTRAAEVIYREKEVMSVIDGL